MLPTNFFPLHTIWIHDIILQLSNYEFITSGLNRVDVAFLILNLSVSWFEFLGIQIFDKLPKINKKQKCYTEFSRNCSQF